MEVVSGKSVQDRHPVLFEETKYAWMST